MIKVNKLTGNDLAGWVARAAGLKLKGLLNHMGYGIWVEDENGIVGYIDTSLDIKPKPHYSPQTTWEQGGPLIPTGIVKCESVGDSYEFYFTGPNGSGYGSGETLLVAAMRALVNSKFGDEVEAINATNVTSQQQ